MDLHNAIRNARLSPVEARVIKATYIDAPTPRRNNKRGRPAGGGPEGIVSNLTTTLLDEPRKRVYETRKDTEYNLIKRSIYWYKKVLDRALSKIDTELNYEDVDDLQALRYMYAQHSHAIEIV